MTYKCAACKLEFETGWTDEESRAEQKANGFNKCECDITCDDCFKKIMVRRSAEAAARGITPQELDTTLEDFSRCVEAEVIPQDPDAAFTEPLRSIMREAFERHAIAAGWAPKDIEVTAGVLSPADRVLGKCAPIYVKLPWELAAQLSAAEFDLRKGADIMTPPLKRPRPPCRECGAKRGELCKGIRGQQLKDYHQTRTLKGSHAPRRGV